MVEAPAIDRSQRIFGNRNTTFDLEPLSAFGKACYNHNLDRTREMDPSRRRFVMATSSLPLVFVAGCWTVPESPNLAVMQGYVKTIQGFVDKVAPIVAALDPAEATNITTIKTNVDAAAAAFEALPANGETAASIAQTIYNLTSEAVAVAEAIPLLPADVKAVLAAVQLLLLVLGDFFNLKPAAAAGPTPPSLRAAQATYSSTPDKKAAARDAANQVEAWLKR